MRVGLRKLQGSSRERLGTTEQRRLRLDDGIGFGTARIGCWTCWVSEYWTFGWASGKV